MRRTITPGLRYSQYVYEDVVGTHVSGDTRWLDVGCGHQVLPEWRLDAETTLAGKASYLIGIDADLPALAKHRTIRLRVGGALPNLPFRDASFDLVTANMVVEHLRSPAADFMSLARVLAPGGSLIIHTPNALGYPTLAARLLPEGVKRFLARTLEGRAAEDVFPTYYRANSARQLHDLAAATDLVVERLMLFSTDAATRLLPPLAFVELLWIRLLTIDRLAFLRSNLIVVFRKQDRARPLTPNGGRGDRTLTTSA
jgi:SAM-dependent methyltransferase